jgi:hypothetical protein
MTTISIHPAQSAACHRVRSDAQSKIIEIHPSAHLSREESGQLTECEEIIRTRLRSFFEVGEALLKIKEKKLYRTRFTTFEAYCRDRWDFSRVHAYQLLHASEIRTRLLPISRDVLPENERQIRPLVGLPAKLAEKAWLKAVKLAGGERLTGTTVAKAVNLVSKHKGRRSASRESWQIDLERMLRKGLRCCRAGDRDGLKDMIHRIDIRLEIGIHRGPESEVLTEDCKQTQ